jgi:hypothetical protein
MGDISDKDKKNRGHHSGVRDARRAPDCGRPSNTETPAARQAREREGRRVRANVSLYLLDCHYTIYEGLVREVNTRVERVPGHSLSLSEEPAKCFCGHLRLFLGKEMSPIDGVAPHVHPPRAPHAERAASVVVPGA